MALDPVRPLQVVDDKLAAASSDDERAMLTALRERLIGEMAGDVDRVAATLADDFTLQSHPANGATVAAARQCAPWCSSSIATGS